MTTVKPFSNAGDLPHDFRGIVPDVGNLQSSGGPAHRSASVMAIAAAVYSNRCSETIGKYKASAVVRSRGPFEVTLRNATIDATPRNGPSRQPGRPADRASGSCHRPRPCHVHQTLHWSQRLLDPACPGYPGNELELTVTALAGSRVSVRSVSAKRVRESHGIGQEHAIS